MKNKVEGWASKNVRLEWLFGDVLGFNVAIHKSNYPAVVSAGEKNVRKVIVTIEVSNA